MSRDEVIQKVKEARERAGRETLTNILFEMGIKPEDKNKPKERNQNARKPVDNFDIAMLWYYGYKLNDIAKRVGLSKMGVIGRLKEMGIYE